MRARALALALVLAACSSSAPQPQPAPGSASAEPGGRTYEGRPIAQTMSYLGADWLDRPDRAEREQPDRVLDALHLAPDSTAADVGAGTGYFTVRLAKRVKAVHATDLQPEMLRMLDVRLGKERITNVTLHRATDHDSGLPVSCCDLVILVDVYHELSDPPGVMVTIRRALKPTGRLVLLEYRGEDPAVAIKPEHKMMLVQIKKELGELGFHFVDSLEMLPDQRVVIFTRDDA
jgi:ubiquinone/menaquinone biosynthesis C-methylase UbiE